MYLSLWRLCFPMTIHESFAAEVEYIGPLVSSRIHGKHPIVLGRRWALTMALSLIWDVSSLPRLRSLHWHESGPSPISYFHSEGIHRRWVGTIKRWMLCSFRKQRIWVLSRDGKWSECSRSPWYGWWHWGWYCSVVVKWVSNVGHVSREFHLIEAHVEGFNLIRS